VEAAASVPSSRIEAEVRRIRELLEHGHYLAALTAAQLLHAEVPQNRDVLYMIGVSFRYLQRVADTGN